MTLNDEQVTQLCALVRKQHKYMHRGLTKLRKMRNHEEAERLFELSHLWLHRMQQVLPRDQLLLHPKDENKETQ